MKALLAFHVTMTLVVISWTISLSHDDPVILLGWVSAYVGIYNSIRAYSILRKEGEL